MIFRKPYAFLIKNFKKIHIFLLLISLFVAYKLIGVSTFVSEFMNLGIYDVYNDPITNYITFFTLFGVLVLIIGVSALLLLLRYKNKPWKIYLFTLIEYVALFFVLNMIKGFFSGYTNDIATTDLRMSRDLLMIFIFLQIPAIGIFGMRVFGIDIQKFNFNSDQEFLELKEEDQEEFEININIDKNSFKRLYKRLFRNLNYFYLEHKKICITIISILLLVGVFNVYKLIFVTNKSYKEGQIYSANGYTITVNNSYYTNKSNDGTVISSNSGFIIIDLTIKNNAGRRTIKMDNFHIKNGVSDYTTTNKMYAEEFKDLGTTYGSVDELLSGEEQNLIIVYKVDSKLDKNGYVLYYQEDGGYLRKIKLKIKDISRINIDKELKIGDSFKFKIGKKENEVSLDKVEFLSSVDYMSRFCNTTQCYVEPQNYIAREGYKVLKIEFGSDGYEGKEMIDFSEDYGKIIYRNSKNKETSLSFKYPFSKKSYGKYIYTLVPLEVETSDLFEIVFTIRDKQYTYKIK